MNKVRKILAILILIASLIFGLWLSLYVMLYGGIMQAYNGFSTGAVSTGVWGVIKALFFEVGMIPSTLGWIISLFVSDYE